MSKTYNAKTTKKTYFDKEGNLVESKDKKSLVLERSEARMKKYMRRSWEFKVKKTKNGLKLTLKK